MFWRATLAIAALYYMTVPPAERLATGDSLREAAARVPAEAVSFCTAQPARCLALARQAEALASPAPAAPPPARLAEPPLPLVEAPLPPRRPATLPARKGA